MLDQIQALRNIINIAEPVKEVVRFLQETNKEQIEVMNKISKYLIDDKIKKEVKENNYKISDEELEKLLDVNYSYFFNINRSYETHYFRTLLEKSTPEDRALLVLGFTRDKNNHGHGFCKVLVQKITVDKEILQKKKFESLYNPHELIIKNEKSNEIEELKQEPTEEIVFPESERDTDENLDTKISISLNRVGIFNNNERRITQAKLKSTENNQDNICKISSNVMK